jgi:hypothetical protein
MVRSPFAVVSYLPQGILAIAVLSLVMGLVFHSQWTSRVMGQQPSETATAAVIRDIAKPAPAATSTDIFVELAASVGEAAAAKRLIDYKLKNDPVGPSRYFAIVDFDQPSTSKRLFVFDTVEKKVIAYYVAHGRGSEGAKDDGVADVFSNQNHSNSSSLGVYRALNEYNGQHGRSLRLEGLEPTNSNVLARGVVMHTADYVSESFIRQTGRLGRSEGCFAVEKSVGDTLINELKNGAYIIASKS